MAWPSLSLPIFCFKINERSPLPSPPSIHQHTNPKSTQNHTALRGSIFTSAKLNLWHEVLRETTTPTVPPADEYERPEELREVALNRMQVRKRSEAGVCMDK